MQVLQNKNLPQSQSKGETMFPPYGVSCSFAMRCEQSQNLGTVSPFLSGMCNPKIRQGKRRESPFPLIILFFSAEESDRHGERRHLPLRSPTIKISSVLVFKSLCRRVSGLLEGYFFLAGFKMAVLADQLIEVVHLFHIFLVHSIMKFGQYGRDLVTSPLGHFI